MPNEKQTIKASHLKFAKQRGGEKTYCPSEVARELYENWRPKMDLVREVADDLVQEGKIHVLQNGEIKDLLPSQLTGPIRLRINNEEE